MATRKPKGNEASLPFDALRLLAPPVRLVSAALWKVMKQRDVSHYAVVEEFVTSACETVPELLTARHQSKLALGLRGRLILELCRKQPDEQVILPHLQRIRAPAALSSSSDYSKKKDLKIQKTVESFHSFVRTLLSEPAERELFFKEEFLVEYGPKFDLELEKLLWEFLLRLDRLLPVPNLAQTVSWLSDTPPVLEECARSATQPQLLKVLLQHQTCLGHLETPASLPPSMGDCILTSLSLPPSGRLPSNKPEEGPKYATDLSHDMQDRSPFIAPVFGTIANKDVPVLSSKSKGPAEAEPLLTAVEHKSNKSEESIERRASKTPGGIKRRQPDISDSEQDEEVFDIVGDEKKEMSRNLEEAARRLTQDSRDHRSDETKEDGAVAESSEERPRADTKMVPDHRGVHLPQSPASRSTFLSCLHSKPRVVLRRLSVTSRGGNSSNADQEERRASPFKTSAPSRASSQHPKSDVDFSSSRNKENCPVSEALSRSVVQQPHKKEMLESNAANGNEDYVADSEDEATKNFKVRLFTKRYYKTKHGTYVPTLREYWKPGTARKDLMSIRSKRR